MRILINANKQIVTKFDSRNHTTQGETKTNIIDSFCSQYCECPGPWKPGRCTSAKPIVNLEDK